MIYFVYRCPTETCHLIMPAVQVGHKYQKFRLLRAVDNVPLAVG